MNLVEQAEPTYFELEDNPWLVRALFLMVGIGGLLMWMVIMSQYGVTSWYRSSYQIGVISTIIGTFLFLFFGKRSRFRLHRETGQVRLRYWQGVRTTLDRKFALKEIEDLRIEKKTHPRWGDQFRLGVRQQGTWLALSPRFSTDLYAIERAGKLLQGQLMQK